MPGPGEYRPDPTEGITRIEDLPQPKVRCLSRNYRRRPCPRCGWLRKLKNSARNSARNRSVIETRLKKLTFQLFVGAERKRRQERERVRALVETRVLGGEDLVVGG